MEVDKVICSGCHTEIMDKEYLACMQCKNVYDLICANVSKQRFYGTLTGEHRATWRCVCCMSKLPKSDNTNTPVRGTTDGINMNRGAAACNLTQNLDDSTLLNDTVEMTDIQSFVLEARQWREEWKATRVQLEVFNGVVTKLTQRLEQSDQRCSQLEQRVDSLERQVTELKANSDKSLQETIERLTADINDRDQELLGNDIEISNIPEVNGENLVHVVTTIADKLCVNLADQDIVSVNRVGRSSESPVGAQTAVRRARPIVVRVVRRSLRDEFLSSARVRRGATTEGTGLPAPYRRFYVNERLTKTNRLLFRQTRELGRTQNWRFVWTRDGRIYVRHHSGPDSPRHRIRNENDLARVFGTAAVGPSSVEN